MCPLRLLHCNPSSLNYTNYPVNDPLAFCLQIGDRVEQAIELRNVFRLAPEDAVALIRTCRAVLEAWYNTYMQVGPEGGQALNMCVCACTSRLVTAARLPWLTGLYYVCACLP